MMQATWTRATRESPCKICGGPDNCEWLQTEDATLVYCGRVSDGSIKENGGGQFLHVLKDQAWTPPPRKRRPKPAPIAQSFDKMAERFFSSPFQELNSRIVQQRRCLSSKLGVSVESLVRLRVGWDPVRSRFTIPERDASGNIIGIATRSTGGKKRFVTGGKRGLTYPRDWRNSDGPVSVVEGGSDTAALMDLGIAVIGRPSNIGGVEMLAEILKEFPHDVLIIGERDEKPDGQFPGRDGAIKTAEKLARLLNRKIGWSFPPGQFKDAREWRSATDGSRGDWFTGLIINQVMPPRVFETEQTTPTVDLQSFRDKAHVAIKGILDEPGFYLDSSTTGAGKSHRDLALVKMVKRSLIVVPSHENCGEVLADLHDEDVEAAAYPSRRMTEKKPLCPRCHGKAGNRCSVCGGEGRLQLEVNCWNADADTAETMGLPVVSAVCPTCTHAKSCKKTGYLHEIREATESPVAISTHARGEHGGIADLGKGRDYQAIHEGAISLIRPQMEVTEPDLAAAICVVEILLSDPRWLDWFGGGKSEKDREQRGEVYDFCHQMLSVAQSIADQIRNAETTAPLRVPAGTPKPRGIEPVLFSVCCQTEAKFSHQPLKALIALAAGNVYQAGIVVNERYQKNQDSRTCPEQSAEGGRERAVC